MAELTIKLVNGELAGKTAQEIGKEISRAGQEARKAEVGTKAWVDAHQRLEKAKKLQQDLRKQVQSTTQASDQLKNAWNNLPGASFFNNIAKSFGMLRAGVGGLTSQFGLLRVAIAATGIGLLVLLLGSLFVWLTKTQAGMDTMTKVTRPLQAIMARLTGVLQELGEKVFKRLGEAIQNPKQAVMDLADAIKNNLIKRFEALALFGPAIAKIMKGEFKEGFTDLGNAALQLTTGVEDMIGKIGKAAEVMGEWIKEGIEVGSQLDALQKRIERAEIDQIKRAQQLNLLIKEQKAIVEDETKSYQEREEAAIKARAAQDALLKSELALMDMKIEKMKIEHGLNDTSRADEKELAELEAQRMALQAQAAERAIEFDKKLNMLRKKQMDEEKATLKSIEDLRIQAMEDGINKEIAQIEMDTERKIEALTGSAEQIKEQEVLLEEIRQRAIQDVRDKYAKEEEDKKKDLAEKLNKIADERAQFERDMAELQQDLAMETYDAATEFMSKLLGEEQAAKVARKTDALAEIGINLQREKAANAVAAAANSLNATTAGAAGAAQLIRANAASTWRAVLGAARVVAFERGGMIRGPRHSGGGVPIEAEGGEFIFSRKAVRALGAHKLATINNYYTKMERGGPVSPFPDRGPVASGAAMGMDANAMREVMKEMWDMNKQQIMRIKVENVVTETEDALQVINSIRDEANV